MKELEKGRTIDTPYGAGRPSRSPSPRREAHRHEDPLRPRAVPEVPEHRPGEGADSGAAGRALHDGRRAHRHRRRDAAAGAVRGGRGRLRQHQRRESARIELAAGAAGVRRPRRARGRRSTPSRQQDPTPAVLVAGQRRAAAAGERRSCRRPAARADRRHPRRDAEDDGGERRHLSGRRVAGDGRGATAPACRSGVETSPFEDHSRTFNTERVAALELCEHARRGRGDRPVGARGARNRAARTSAPISLRATIERYLAHSLDPPTAPTARRGSNTRRSRSPAGRRPSGSMGRRQPMADHITLQVARYRPEQESEATFDEYEVPCPKDWVVLDGLNHIKDRLDGTLSYRWSCRMGICGSCGMTVNGEPKLTCATFLTDYAPGPVRVEPLKNFPIIRDLIVDIDDFMRKLVQRQAVARPERREAAVGRRIPADSRGAGRVQAVQHVHQLHAVLRGVPGCRPRSELHRAGGDRAGPAVQPRQPRRGRRRAAATSSPSTKASGAARSSANAPRCARSTSIPRAPSSATS